MKSIALATIPLALLALGSATLAAPAQSQGQLIGKAPQFSAATADGKAYDIKTATKDGPVYLFFIKKDCPVTAGAMSFYTSISKAYGAKTPILGVFSGDAQELKAYNAEHKLPFPTVLDPKLTMIASYKVQTSPWVVEVKTDGNVGKIWKGYSQDYLQQINKAAAGAAGMPVAKVDFSDAPKEARYG